MNMSRTPLFFGPEDRSLFGWYHAPETPADLGVVLCPPPGHEGINAHRSVRHLADALAKAGMPALRFDYDGTGDSAGTDEDPGRVNAWRDSIVTAMAALRELSGCTRIALAGLRLGATLAALVAMDHEVDALLLWFPLVLGRAWVREMKALHLTGVTRDAPAEAGVIEPGGFVITDETQRDLGTINLQSFVPKAKRVLIVTREDLSSDTSLWDEWRAAGVAAEQRAVSGFTEMFLPPHSAVVPMRAIEEIVGWVTGGFLGVPRGSSEFLGERGNPEELRGTRGTAPGLRETLVRFGENHGIFGIISEPADGTATAPAIVLSNAGSAHHVGPNRLYVLLARALSTAGFRCLRFDLPGLGDSVIDDAARENNPYPPDASASIAEAAAIVARPNEPVILTGLCSGAHASFHAALDLETLPIAESVIINPLTFYYEPGMSLEQSPVRHYEEWQRYTESMRSTRSWAKLLRGEVRIRAVLRNVFARFRDVAISRLRAMGEWRGRDDDAAPGRPDLGRDLRRIARTGRKLTFVFSRLDPGYDLLMIAGAGAVRRLEKQGMLTMWRIAGATHTFEASRARQVMIESLVEHLRRRYPSAE
jgi:alpha/beta superfamily hydrolase